MFVLPGAFVGAYADCHSSAGTRSGALVLIVVVVPALLWPAGLTGDFSELSRRL
jgi:hypothetical protein